MFQTLNSVRSNNLVFRLERPNSFISKKIISKKTKNTPNKNNNNFEKKIVKK